MPCILLVTVSNNDAKVMKHSLFIVDRKMHFLIMANLIFHWTEQVDWDSKKRTDLGIKKYFNFELSRRPQ